MAKSNIVNRSYRLNLDDEQQRRVNKVLAGLNKDIHKSVNQFITDAIDFYANSFKDESLLREAGERKKKEEEYILRSDLEGIREELKNEVKNEIIILLGAALGGGAARMAEGSMGKTVMETVAKETVAGNTEEIADPTVMELVENWG
ncbi:MAG: hypothetical protein HFH43_05720 [Lachnospiraceae bacterium]|nr:hypothetical protein [Lachnospiraceae bacterium]